MSAHEAPVELLSHEESIQLLAGREFGRIGLVLAGRPEIFPVNYAARGGQITFRTAEGTKLFGVSLHEDVVFEVDDFDERSGWSVIVKGRARILQTRAELDEVDDLGLRPWIATVKANAVRIDIAEISGRRFHFGPEPEQEPETAS